VRRTLELADPRTLDKIARARAAVRAHVWQLICATPGLLATAVCPARTRLTSRPAPVARKGGRPGAVGAGAPEHIGPSAIRCEHLNQIQPPKTGTTRSVTKLAPPLNR
jgi:hypothetical protein